jgi:hypothetical protein
LSASILFAILSPHSANAQASRVLEPFGKECVRLAESIVPDAVIISSTKEQTPISKIEKQQESDDQLLPFRQFGIHVPPFLAQPNQMTKRESSAPSPTTRVVKLPEYITTEEVQRVCRELGIRDWATLKKSSVPIEEARIIQNAVGAEATQISVEMFRDGLEVELEHGLHFPDANVTHNHPLLTGKIVLAHLKETLDYYSRLEVVELEGDILKALSTGDMEKLAGKYRKLISARAALSAIEVSILSQK